MFAFKTIFCVLAACSLVTGYSIESRIKRQVPGGPESPVAGGPGPNAEPDVKPQVPQQKPEVPGVPKVPEAPEVPASAGPQAPEGPSAPSNSPRAQIPQIPGIPSSEGSVPQLPGVPSSDPSVPQLPGVPSGPMPQIPSIPGLGAIPSQLGPEVFKNIAERVQGAIKDTIAEEKAAVQNGISAVKDKIQQDFKTGAELAKTQANLGLAFPKFIKNVISRN